MIENYVSVIFGIVEIICFSSICFGFPFIQYIMIEEGIFGKVYFNYQESFRIRNFFLKIIKKCSGDV